MDVQAALEHCTVSQTVGSFTLDITLRDQTNQKPEQLCVTSLGIFTDVTLLICLTYL